LSKKEFVLSKFYTVILLALISTIFVFFVSLILGYSYSDFNEISIVTTDLEYLIAFFVKLVAFFSFGLFLGILVKRSAFAVGAMLVWFWIESFAKGMLYWKFETMVANVMQFFPLEAMSNLIKEPFTRIGAVKTVAKQVGEDLSKDFSVQPKDLVIVLVWTAIFIYASYVLLKKRDL
jgi:ABC-2 type transport system permease protein